MSRSSLTFLKIITHEFLVVTFPEVYFLYTYLKDFKKSVFVESIKKRIANFGLCGFHCSVRFISRTRPTSNQIQELYSTLLHDQAKRNGTPGNQPLLGKFQGTRLKGMEMALVWHEKVSRTALQTGSLSQTHTLLVQTHKHEYSQGKCRTMLSVIIKLE